MKDMGKKTRMDVGRIENKMQKEQIKEKLKNNKAIIIVFIFWILISYSMYLAYNCEWESAMGQPVDIVEVGKNEEKETVPLKEQAISQEIKADFNVMTGFSLYFNMENVYFDGVLDTELIHKDSNKKIQEWRIDFNEIKGDGYFNFTLEKPLELKKNETLVINLKMENHSKFIPKLVLADNKNRSKAALEINGEASDKIIPYKIANGNHSGLRYFALALYIGMTIVLVAMTIMAVKKTKTEHCFVVSALLLGMIYMFVLPPFVVPDETAHFLTVYEKSSRLLGEEALDHKGNVLVPSEKLWGNVGHKTAASRDRYLDFMKGVLGKGGEEEMGSDADKSVSTRPALWQTAGGYFPQIAGVSAARLFHMNSDRILFMGRLFSLLWYCFVMFWAIRLIPFGKTTLFIIGILPMTLQQVVSYNYDSTLLGICFFAVADLLYMKYVKEKILWYDIALLTFIVVIISLVKFVYLPIIGITVLIPKEKYGGVAKKRLALGVLAVSSVIVVLAAKLATLNDIAQPAAETAGRAAVKMSLSYCLGHPVEMIEICYRTLERQTSGYISQMLATPLGYLDTPLPEIVVYALILILLFSILKCGDEVWYEVRDVRRYSAAITILITGMIMAALLLSWTTEDAVQIDGIQGRYFLPILPLIVVLTQNHLIVLKRNIDQYLIVFMGCVQCISVYFITLTALGR